MQQYESRDEGFGPAPCQLGDDVLVVMRELEVHRVVYRMVPLQVRFRSVPLRPDLAYFLSLLLLLLSNLCHERVS